MYLAVALVAAFVTVAAASKCCVPPSWVGTVGTLSAIVHNGKMHNVRGNLAFVYDGFNHKIGMQENIQIDLTTSMQVDVLLDFDRNTRWIRTAGDCMKTDLGRTWQDGCIPDNATVVGSNNYYGFSTNNITVDTYMLEAGNSRFYFTVQSSNCMPVQETNRGIISGNYFLQNNGYVNVSMGIPADVAAGISGVPDRCQNARTVPTHYVEGLFNLPAVGRRSFLLDF